MTQIRTIIHDPVTPDLVYHHFGSVKRLIVGKGAVSKIGVETKNLGSVEGVLLLTDEGVKRTNLVEKVMNPLKTEGLQVEVYDKVEPERSIESFRNVAEVVRDTKYDVLIALGGGSSMDTTKVAAALWIQLRRPHCSRRILVMSKSSWV